MSLLDIPYSHNLIKCRLEYIRGLINDLENSAAEDSLDTSLPYVDPEDEIFVNHFNDLDDGSEVDLLTEQVQCLCCCCSWEYGNQIKESDSCSRLI